MDCRVKGVCLAFLGCSITCAFRQVVLVSVNVPSPITHMYVHMHIYIHVNVCVFECFLFVSIFTYSLAVFALLDICDIWEAATGRTQRCAWFSARFSLRISVSSCVQLGV